MGREESPKNILLILPNWVGDTVLATPTLKAIKEGFPDSRITYLIRPHLAELIEGLEWFDELLFWPAVRYPKRPKQTLFNLIQQIKEKHFDLAVILPNSFKSALICALGNIPRRVGYARDGRGFLLTDRLLPDKYNGRFLPTPLIKYYLGIANYLGCPVDTDPHPILITSPRDEQEAQSLFIRHSIKADSGYAILNPGAAYGSSKCWPPEYFAKVADYLIEKKGMNVLIPSGPGEERIAEKVKEHMKNRAVVLTDPVVGLGTLKALIKNCRILITNDSGPRHIGIAFRRPLITLFGPIDPQWTETFSPNERKLKIDIECSPCNKRTCPKKHHRCMVELKPERVIHHINELL